MDKMKSLLLLSFVFCLSSVHCILTPDMVCHDGACECSDWRRTFNRRGLSTCETRNYGIRGFYRNDKKNPDYIYLLEKAVCCRRAWQYSATSNYVYANWWRTLDSANTWAYCPPGFFLQGIWREGYDHWLSRIEEGRCWKPADHPYRYGRCYEKNIKSAFDKKGFSQCNSNFFITGLHRGDCNELHCLDRIQCCEMAPKPDELNSLNRVKTLVMDITLYDMAQLANYLGFGWCHGCRAEGVGEDFRRFGDTWEADQSEPCSGHKKNHRLSINYDHWSFAVKHIYYGPQLTTDLQPETFNSGILMNMSPTNSTYTITGTEDIARTVTHTTTSSWKKTKELGIEISYTPPVLRGDLGFKSSFKFGYENSSTTTDSKGNVPKNIISSSYSKELEPFSAIKFDLAITKTRTTQSYTATIIAKFSAEFRGFLRWGGGKGKKESNYHYQHHGSGDRPTFNYRFGDANTTFFEALKYQSESMQRPWEWGILQKNYAEVRGVINKLTYEKQYEFTLTGKFDDVVGKQINIIWSNGFQKRDTSLPIYDTEIVDLGHHSMVAVEMPGDPKPIFPPAPEVDIQVPDMGEETAILESSDP